MLDRGVWRAADGETKLERAFLEIAQLDFIMEAGRKRIIRIGKAHVRPILQLELSLRLTTKSQIAQFPLGGDPPAQLGPFSAEQFARLVEMKNKITVRLHRLFSLYSLGQLLRYAPEPLFSGRISVVVSARGPFHIPYINVECSVTEFTLTYLKIMMVLLRRSRSKNRILLWDLLGGDSCRGRSVSILPIRSGPPYIDYIDEGHVLHQTIDAFNNRNLDVSWYGLPPFPAYCAGSACSFTHHSTVTSMVTVFRMTSPAEPGLRPPRQNYDFIAPVELILAGRVATACLSIATVILAGIFAGAWPRSRRPPGDASGGGMSRPGDSGSIVIEDTFATFFVLAVLCICARILGKGPNQFGDMSVSRDSPPDLPLPRNILPGPSDWL